MEDCLVASLDEAQQDNKAEEPLVDRLSTLN